MRCLTRLTPCICLASSVGVSQTPPTPAAEPKPSIRFEYEKECGSPLVESMVWVTVDGKVTRILDDASIEIETADQELKRVTLAAVDSSRDAKAAQATLTGLVLNKDVSVLLNPGNRQSTDITGMVRFQVTSINRVLIESGVVAFREPQSYSMSRHTTCVYRILERKSQKTGLGIWRDGSL